VVVALSLVTVETAWHRGYGSSGCCGPPPMTTVKLSS
jgi:hypothetical protein